MTKGEQIFFRLGTLNVNSLKVVRKRRNVLRQLKSHCDATRLQESKLDGTSAIDVCKDDSGSWAFYNRTTKSGGVAIHLQEKLGRYTDDDEFNNVDGSVVGQSVEFNGYKLYLVSVYAPCCGKSKSRLAANMEILNEVEKLVISMKAKRHEVIVSGDLKFIRDDLLDADSGSPEIYKEQLDWIDPRAKYCGIFDAMRFLRPNERLYLWSKPADKIHRCLDYIFCSRKMLECACHTSIVAVPKTDHRLRRTIIFIYGKLRAHYRRETISSSALLDLATW
jgi:exonuclease III